MDAGYQQLLAATVAHLEDLKRQGVRHLVVSPDHVRALTQHQSPPSSPADRPSPDPRRAASTPATAAPRESRPTSTPRATPTAPPPPPIPIPAADPVAAEIIEHAQQPLSREQKETEMARLRERAMVCVKCPNLAKARHNVVFGVGDIHADLMFVGEAPGMDEDAAGEPFVGAAGQLLTRIIQTMGLSRDTVYIANVLKCRPDTPGQSTGNRKPTADEMRTCRPYLMAQISVIRPKVIVALGGSAVEGLMGRAMGIMKLRGNWQDFNGTPMMPTYHPAYLLRNQSLREKRKVWEDMLQVMERLNLPISEKHRGYFLKQ